VAKIQELCQWKRVWVDYINLRRWGLKVFDLFSGFCDCGDEYVRCITRFFIVQVTYPRKEVCILKLLVKWGGSLLCNWHVSLPRIDSPTVRQHSQNWTVVCLKTVIIWLGLVKCGRACVQLGARFVNARLCRRFMGVFCGIYKSRTVF
jgi:hypothetical protein